MPILTPRRRRLLAILGWVLLAVLVFATLSPIGLRPRLLAIGPAMERFAAYGVFAFCITLAYPRWRWPVLLTGLFFVVALEAGQYITESRHGRLSDALVKAAGFLSGFVAARVLDRRAGEGSQVTATEAASPHAKPQPQVRP